jgi:hypothetical protein
MGSIPVITWEPWLTDFDAESYPHLRKVENRDKGGMADVAKGEYDTYIQNWADDARSTGRPIFIRLGHEMNDPYRYPWGPHNNSAKNFIAAWRHVHNLFVGAGATNVMGILMHSTRETNLLILSVSVHSITGTLHNGRNGGHSKRSSGSIMQNWQPLKNRSC